jgi:hypothetical protein
MTNLVKGSFFTFPSLPGSHSSVLSAALVAKASRRFNLLAFILDPEKSYPPSYLVEPSCKKGCGAYAQNIYCNDAGHKYYGLIISSFFFWTTVKFKYV